MQPRCLGATGLCHAAEGLRSFPRLLCPQAGDQETSRLFLTEMKAPQRIPVPTYNAEKASLHRVVSRGGRRGRRWVPCCREAVQQGVLSPRDLRSAGVTATGAETGPCA